MEFCRFLRSVKFVVRSLGRFFCARCLPVHGYSGVSVAAFFENWHIFSHLLLKSVSSLQRRLSLRN